MSLGADNSDDWPYQFGDVSPSHQSVSRYHVMYFRLIRPWTRQSYRHVTSPLERFQCPKSAQRSLVAISHGSALSRSSNAPSAFVENKISYQLLLAPPHRDSVLLPSTLALTYIYESGPLQLHHSGLCAPVQLRVQPISSGP